MLCEKKGNIFYSDTSTDQIDKMVDIFADEFWNYFSLVIFFAIW